MVYTEIVSTAYTQNKWNIPMSIITKHDVLEGLTGS